MRYVWIAVMLLPLPASAGAWLQEAGRTLLSRQATFYTTDEYFNEGGNATAQSRFSKEELNLYGEYGWSDHLTLGTNLFLNRVSQSGESNLGIADSEFFARLLLWKGKHSLVSLQPLIKLPSLYEQSGSPRGGTNSTDTELSLLMGHSFRLLSETDYIDARFGYRERSGQKAQWRTDIAYGVTLTDQWQLVSAIRSIYAVELDTQSFSNSGTLDYDLGKAEITALYHIDYWQDVQFSYFSHIAGRQTGGGQGFSLGLTQRF